mmetsp:Transcript_3029/g.4337  ORF Transcript_3029/g.4337 Transcript_3029/m.4337 type:complete len:94 (+) Transcript_3029:33-314(+)
MVLKIPREGVIWVGMTVVGIAGIFAFASPEYSKTELEEKLREQQRSGRSHVRPHTNWEQAIMHPKQEDLDKVLGITKRGRGKHSNDDGEGEKA